MNVPRRAALLLTGLIVVVPGFVAISMPAHAAGVASDSRNGWSGGSQSYLVAGSQSYVVPDSQSYAVATSQSYATFR